MIRLCVFDMDGLLLDSERQIYLYNGMRISKELGYPIDEAFLRSMMGNDWGIYESKTAEHMGKDFPIDRYMSLLREKNHYVIRNEAIPLRPGAKELLDFCKENGYLMAKQLFSEKPEFTAIFASTDTNALGILQAAEEKGIRIPDDLSLLGFDNIRDSGLPRIGLTTIEQPRKLLASMAVDSLLDKIENELSGYTHRILTPTLVERTTCRAVTPEG